MSSNEIKGEERGTDYIGPNDGQPILPPFSMYCPVHDPPNFPMLVAPGEHELPSSLLYGSKERSVLGVVLLARSCAYDVVAV